MFRGNMGNCVAWEGLLGVGSLLFNPTISCLLCIFGGFRKEGAWDVAPRTRKAHFRLLHIEVSYLWRYWVPLFLRLVSTGKPKNPTIWGAGRAGERGGVPFEKGLRP